MHKVEEGAFSGLLMAVKEMEGENGFSQEGCGSFLPSSCMMISYFGSDGGTHSTAISLCPPLAHFVFVVYTQMRAADAKAAKTSSNLGTKFQQTQQMWSRPTRSMTQVFSLSPMLNTSFWTVL